MTRTQLDPATRARLVDLGHMTPSGLGRAAQLRDCPRCHAIVIRGLDARTCALEVTCDPVRLNRVGELAAILAGRQTYELWGKELERREPNKIRHGMAQPVVAAHVCPERPPLDPVIIRLWLPGYLQPKPKEVDVCPF